MLSDLKRFDEAHVLNRAIYARRVAIFGVEDEDTIISASLINMKLLMAALIQAPERTRDDLRLRYRRDPIFDRNTGDDMIEAETILQDLVKRRRRLLGPAHPETRKSETGLSKLRALLAHA